MNVIGFFTKHMIWGFVQKIGKGRLVGSNSTNYSIFFKTSAFAVNFWIY